MKKIVAAIDMLNFSEDLLSNLKFIAREVNGKLSIVFLENIIAGGIPLASAYPEAYTANYQALLRESIAERDRLRKEHLDYLFTICGDGEVEFTLHESIGSPVQKVVEESRFADLLLISSSTSFATLYDSKPPQFVKDVLVLAQCPVMVLPEKGIRIKELIFSYNGTFSSMYAIRQFTQLFPDLSDIPVNLVYVAEGNHTTLPNESLVMSYLDNHYDEVKYTVLQGDPAAEFLNLLSHHRHCLVTYGAFGRSTLSRFFHRSEAENVLRNMDIPVFITHP